MKCSSRNILLLIAGALAMVLSACGGGGGGGGSSGGGPTIKPRFAVVANKMDNSISTYVVTSASGRLEWIGKVASDSHPESVTVDPSGQYAYAANNSSGKVSQYTIGPDGSLSPIGGGTVLAGAGPSSVTVDPSGKYAFVANASSNDISAYTIDLSTGALSQINCSGGGVCNGNNFLAGTNPVSVTVHPSGKYAYTANGGSNNVSAYLIDASTGALTPIDSNPATLPIDNFVAGTNPVSVTITPSGKYAYVANNGSGDVSAYTVNVNTGALTPIDADSGTGGIQNFPAGTNPVSVAVAPSGKYAYVPNFTDNNVSQYTIGADGGLIPMGTPSVGAGTNPESVLIDPSGKYAYATNSGSNDLSQYSIGADGSLSPLIPVTAPAYNGPYSIALTHGTASVSAVPKFAYAANFGSDDVSGYTIDGSSGALAGIGSSPSSAGTQPYSVAVDPSGKFAYVANYFTNDVSAYTIDAGTGALTRIDCGGGAGCNGQNFLAGTNPFSITVDPLGRFVYVINFGTNDVSAYTIDASTGALTQIDCGGGIACNGSDFKAGTNPVSVVVYPSGQYAYVANNGDSNVEQYTIGADGSLAPMSPATVPTGASPSAVTVDPLGRFVYVTNFGTNDVSAYTIDAGTGALTPIDADSGTGGIQNFPAGAGPIGLTLDPGGQLAYVTNYTDNNISQYSIGAGGNLTPIGSGTVSAGTNPNSVTVDPSGKYAYVVNKGSGTVSQYKMGSSGGLSPMNPAAVSAGTSPISIITIGTWQ